jgi:hypothetical protein
MRGCVQVGPSVPRFLYRTDLVLTLKIPATGWNKREAAKMSSHGNKAGDCLRIPKAANLCRQVSYPGTTIPHDIELRLGARQITAGLTSVVVIAFGTVTRTEIVDVQAHVRRAYNAPATLATKSGTTFQVTRHAWAITRLAKICETWAVLALRAWLTLAHGYGLATAANDTLLALFSGAHRRAALAVLFHRAGLSFADIRTALAFLGRATGHPRAYVRAAGAVLLLRAWQVRAYGRPARAVF